MRIEVTIGTEEPVIYTVKKPKLIIGSIDTADIFIPSTAGVSRKHVQLFLEGDKLFVADMGSTNGSYINDERLVPGTRSEVTTFFPVRLGDMVWLSITSDDAEDVNFSSEPFIEDVKLVPEMKAIEKNDMTRTIVRPNSFLKQGNGPRHKATSNKKVPSTVTDSSPMKTTIIAVVLGVTAAYSIYINKNKKAVTPSVQPQVTPEATSEVVPVVPVVPKVQQPSLVAASAIPSTEDFQKAFTDLKCVTDLEKKLCELIPGSTQSHSGVIESMGRVIIMMPEYDWYRSGLDFIPANLANMTQRTQLNMLLFLKSLPEFDWKTMEKNIFIVFYREKESRPVIASIQAVKSSVLPVLLTSFPTNFPQILTSKGISQLDQPAKYFTVIQATTELPVEAIKVAVPIQTSISHLVPDNQPMPPPQGDMLLKRAREERAMEEVKAREQAQERANEEAKALLRHQQIAQDEMKTQELKGNDSKRIKDENSLGSDQMTAPEDLPLLQRK
ncbi:MAG TPA: FHA domain-containing protein [Bacteriovoracaceae bacterium]|nr:FHA domain-containing protein [Bacteriovoracaceae bacterium]